MCYNYFGDVMKRNNRELINDNGDSFSMKKLLIILIIMAAIFTGFYFLTKYVLENKTDNNTQQSVIQKDKIIFGQMFNRSEEEYYVIAYYDSKQAKNLYNRYIADYEKKSDHLKVYEINLDESFNKSFISNSENIVNNIDELKVVDETLFKIKNKTVELHKTGSTEINNYLKEISK